MKILLVQLSWLGDCVLATPVLRALSDGFPEATIDVLTTPLAKPVFSCNPSVNQVLTFDKRGAHKGMKGLRRMASELAAEDYQRVYSLHRSSRTSVLLALAGINERIGFRKSSLGFLYHRLKLRSRHDHEVLRNLAILSGECQIADSPELELYEEQRSAVAEKFAATRPVVLFPSSSWFTKQWHGKGFRSVAEYFLNKGKQVVILGAPNETEYNKKVVQGLDVIDLTGRTTISETLSVVSHAGLVVCNDSFGLHIASAFKRPTVVVFCATSPEFGFGPWNNPCAEIVEVSGLHCKPCRRHGGKTCPTGTEICMQVPAWRVIMAAERVLYKFRKSLDKAS